MQNCPSWGSYQFLFLQYLCYKKAISILIQFKLYRKMFASGLLILSSLLISSALCGILNKFQEKPSDLKSAYPEHEDTGRAQLISRNINELTDNDIQNAWELSGFHEGDIVGFDSKNGIIGDEYRWPFGIVPYYIEDDEFSAEDELVIMKALEEYHNKTCIKFRPYKKSDEHFVWFRANSSGCWSSVGMQPEEGQILHLQK